MDLDRVYKLGKKWKWNISMDVIYGENKYQFNIQIQPNCLLVFEQSNC